MVVRILGLVFVTVCFPIVSMFIFGPGMTYTIDRALNIRDISIHYHKCSQLCSLVSLACTD